MTLAFVNGFQEAVSQKIFSFWGHIRLQHYEQYKSSIAEESPIEKNDSIAHAISGIQGVQRVQPFATKYAILKTSESIEGVLFKGVDSSYDFSAMQQFLTQGRWVHFNDSSYSREIVLSEYTAKQLRLKLNDKILIYFFRGGDQKPRPDKLTVVGLYRTYMEEYDKLFAITSLAFWTTRVYSIHEFYFALILLFSGQFVPLPLMPKVIQDIAQYLPFQLLLYFPVQLILGKLNTNQIVQGYIMAGVWLAVSILLFNWVWRNGVKRFSAVGA